MAGMAVYRTPPGPGGRSGTDVVRVVDPLGLAIAWVVPALGGACVGFSVREDAGQTWRPMLEGDGEGGDAAPGIEPLVRLDDDTAVPARLSGMTWTMLERDPTRVITTCVGCADRHTVAVGCEDGDLEIALTGDRFVGLRLTIPGAGEHNLEEGVEGRSRSSAPFLYRLGTSLVIESAGDLARVVAERQSAVIDYVSHRARGFSTRASEDSKVNP